MKLRKQYRISQVSRWRYLLLLPIPFAMATFITAFWLEHRISLYVDQKDEGVIRLLIMLLLAIHGSIAKTVIDRISIHKTNALTALYLPQPDENMFLQSVFQCIPRKTKILLSITSIMIFVSYLIYPIESEFVGLIVVWLTMFLLAILWQYANTFDDMFGGLDPIKKEEVVNAFGENFYSKYFED